MAFVTRCISGRQQQHHLLLPANTILRKFSQSTTIRTSSSSSSLLSPCWTRATTATKANNPLVLLRMSNNIIGNNIGNRIIPTKNVSYINSNRIACWRRWNSNGPNKSGNKTTTTTNNTTNKSNTSTPKATTTSFLANFLAPKQMPPRNTPKWYAEMALLCTVFGITGSSTMFLVRPAVSEGLGLEGSMKDGPWSYRICSLVIMTPMYAAILVVVGTAFGRHAYFRHFSVKMFSRFGVPPELMDRNFRENAKNFRKW